MTEETAGAMKEAFERAGAAVQRDAFDADMEAAPRQVPPRVIDELCEACRVATDYSSAFSDACKAQAEKYKLASGALKRYVAALVGDNVAKVQKDNDDLAKLLMSSARDE